MRTRVALLTLRACASSMALIGAHPHRSQHDQVRRCVSIHSPVPSSRQESRSFDRRSEREGDWTCECGFRNFAFRLQCFQCHQTNPHSSVSLGASRSTLHDPVSVTDEGDDRRRGVPSTAPPQPYLNGDWTCQCGTHNFARRRVCITCMQPRTDANATVFHQPRGVRGVPGIGRDANRGHGEGTPFHQRGRERTFSHSDAAPSQSKQQLLPGDWMCPSCSAHNFRSRQVCFGCGEAKPPSLESDQVQKFHDAERTGARGWVCDACHTTNHRGTDVCTVCGAACSEASHAFARQGGRDGGQSSAGRREGVRPGDWSCPMCGFHNFASRAKCKVCAAGQPDAEARDGADEQNGARTSAAAQDDEAASEEFWVCSCGYKNYATRGSCRDCGSEKPVHGEHAQSKAESPSAAERDTFSFLS